MVNITPVIGQQFVNQPDPQPGDIVHCARCGSDHRSDELDWQEFKNPMVGIVRIGGLTGEGLFTHWAMCPDNDEPILFWRGKKSQ